MKNKRIILLIGVLLLAVGLIGFFLIEREGGLPESKNINPMQHKAGTEKPLASDVEKKSDANKIQTNLYSETTNYIPFFSAVEISKLPTSTKTKVSEILSLTQGAYLLKQNPDNKEIFVILQNPISNDDSRYIRHNIQTAKIDSEDNANYFDEGFCGEENETENAVVQNKNEEWVFDETAEPYRPLKHVMYDKKKKVLYTEKWNYDDAEPVKYELTDGNGRVKSVKKETRSIDMEYREEHVFYNEEGNTVKSISITYDGADIKWFTFYDLKNPDENITIESIYENGLKTAEKIYNQEYKLVKTIKADYQNGEITALEVVNTETDNAQ